MAGRFLAPLALGLVFVGASCTVVPPPGAPLAMARGPISNPIFVAVNSSDANSQLFVAGRASDVLARYNFEIDTTNQLEGTIATRYKVGAGVLEPWHRDSVGLESRLQSTFQSIRRKVLVHLTPVDGGYLVSIEALKEIEDPTAPTPNSPGGNSFVERNPLRRDLDRVLGQASPSGWLPQGRDLPLEQDMLCQLESAYRRK